VLYSLYLRMAKKDIRLILENKSKKKDASVKLGCVKWL